MPAPERPERGDAIAQLLAGTYRDPESGALLHAEAKAVVIEESLEGSECELIAQLGAVDKAGRIAVVSDPATHAVLGARVEEALRSRFTIDSIVLDEPRADEMTVEMLLASLEPTTQLVVAVGTGTLNDLSKMVAFRLGCPSAVFATAPSMNGYTSLSASITTEGLKTSFRTRTPLGVYFDLRVLAAAPPRLIRAGLGDSACRSTAQADWLLSHLLLDRPYREAPFALLASDERDVLAHSAALLAGDLEVMRHLVRTLVLSGFGMTICNGSYPASQGEHLLAHYVGMMGKGVPPTFHGEQIAACTVAMAELQQRILDRDAPPLLRPTHVTQDDVMRHFGPVMGPACWTELAQKRLDAAATDAINARLARDWESIRVRLAAVSIPHGTLRAALADAGAPVDPSQLGWGEDLWRNALIHAREIRNRYTFLDLTADRSSGSHFDDSDSK
jgi:glycerol-1-phosphate dehydrogenase [NAD(P)+]